MEEMNLKAVKKASQIEYSNLIVESLESCAVYFSSLIHFT
jgi:hypothetical protein